MAHIVFYQKPGCINNTKQLKLLTAAGHQVEPMSLLEHGWTAAQLQAFFATKPLTECFNYTAPAIKNGEIDPQTLSDEQALAAMIAQPLLIKRPLMIIDGQHFIQGFDQHYIDQLIGLTAQAGEEQTVSTLLAQDLETCPRQE